MNSPDTALFLPHRALIEVSGVDALAFLQGQISADASRISEKRSVMASFNNVKGRMLAVFYVSLWNNSYWIETQRDIAESLLKKLRMYVLRSKVTLTLREDIGVYGHFSDDSEKLSTRELPEVTNILELKEFETVTGPNFFAFRLPGTEKRFQSYDSITSPPDTLGANSPALSDWIAADIRAKIPLVTAATQDQFISLNAGLQNFGGISFEKGCYTGQEIIARMHYRSTLKQQPYVVEGSGDPPDMGSKLEYNSSNGEVMNVAATSNGWIALLISRISEEKQSFN